MSKKIDIDGLDYSELQTLIAEAHTKSEAKRKESLLQAVEAVKSELIKRGFTLADLLAFVSVSAETEKKGKRKRGEEGERKVAPKFRDPANPENTWTGRGIRPKWLSAKIEGGASLDDFRI